MDTESSPLSVGRAAIKGAQMSDSKATTMVFPIDEVRRQFPALAKACAYLDNPAGTQVPRSVIEAVAAAMTDAASNLGGYFADSKAADAIYESALYRHGGPAWSRISPGNSGRSIDDHVDLPDVALTGAQLARGR